MDYPPPLKVDTPQCVWTEDDNGDWATECGGMFTVNTDSPSANGMVFCPYCGNALLEKPLSEDELVDNIAADRICCMPVIQERAPDGDGYMLGYKNARAVLQLISGGLVPGYQRIKN